MRIMNSPVLRLSGFPVALAGLLLVVAGPTAHASLLLQYNPTGFLLSANPLPPSWVDPSVNAGNLAQVGLESFWSNVDVWTVGRISSSTTIPLGEYLSFTVAPTGGESIAYQGLQYDKSSYLDAGPLTASLRSSLDLFSSDLDTLAVSPSGFQSLFFDLSDLPAASTAVEFRLYFYGAPINRLDWSDLVGTGGGGNGLRLTGEVVPEPAGCAWAVALGSLGWVAWRRLGARA